MTVRNKYIPENIMALPENSIAKYPEYEEFYSDLKKYCQLNHCGQSTLEYMIQCGVRPPSFIELEEFNSSLFVRLESNNLNRSIFSDEELEELSEMRSEDELKLFENIAKFLSNHCEDLSRMLELEENYVNASYVNSNARYNVRNILARNYGDM